jgi:trans-aconitate 2-methyltransferase
MADWDPELYNRFRRYRAEPVEMIFARLALGPGESIIDLGCGSGENTIELARRGVNGTALGIDSSPAMIESALKLRAGLNPELAARVNFALRDMRELNADHAYSVVFSNAALQWVEDHRGVLAACYSALRPGGILAVQVPANEDEGAQVAMHALANEAPWHEWLGAVRTPSKRSVLKPEEYRVMLGEIGFVGIDCHYHTFHHSMQSSAEVVEFYRATALRPFLDQLPEERRAPFADELTRRLERDYGTRGPLTFDFRRLFLWARRPQKS